jgi:hypothetical protein
LEGSKVQENSKDEQVQSEEPITEPWLCSVGFKWHEFERQGSKQWLLWLGDACRRGRSFEDTEDLGIEVASSRDGWWFCWLRSDGSHRYSRFLHIRHIRFQNELIAMIEGLTGQAWDPANNRMGAMLKPERAAWHRERENRLDQRIIRETTPWRSIEQDPSRGGALPEHMQAAIDAGKAK